MAAKCLLPGCGWESQTHIPEKHISGCLATWHVYEKHPDVWKSVFGDKPPADPDVRTKEGMKTAMIEILCQ